MKEALESKEGRRIMTVDRNGQNPLSIMINRIVGELDRVISENLMKWRMFSANWILEIEDYYGKPIRYRGIRFEGSPREVFWKGYIEPFLENGIIKSFEELDNICKIKNLDSSDYINEMQGLLISVIRKAYKNMARTDQILRGNGFPDSVISVDVSSKISAMENHLNEYIAAFTYKKAPLREEVKGDIIGLKPGIWGISIDVRVLWRKLKKHIGI